MTTTKSPWRTRSGAPESSSSPRIYSLFRANHSLAGLLHVTTYHSMDEATFEMSFRKNPFNGEYTVFAGLEECLRLVSAFRFSPQGTHSHFRQIHHQSHLCFHRYRVSSQDHAWRCRCRLLRVSGLSGALESCVVMIGIDFHIIQLMND